MKSMIPGVQTQKKYKEKKIIKKPYQQKQKIVQSQQKKYVITHI
jgi:hypothetical protein